MPKGEVPGTPSPFAKPKGGYPSLKPKGNTPPLVQGGGVHTCVATRNSLYQFPIEEQDKTWVMDVAELVISDCVLREVQEHHLTDKHQLVLPVELDPVFFLTTDRRGGVDTAQTDPPLSALDPGGYAP